MRLIVLTVLAVLMLVPLLIWISCGITAYAWNNTFYEWIPNMPQLDWWHVFLVELVLSAVRGKNILSTTADNLSKGNN